MVKMNTEQHDEEDILVLMTLDGAHLQVVQVGNEPPFARAHDQALLEEEHLEIFSKIKRFKMKKNT